MSDGQKLVEEEAAEFVEGAGENVETRDALEVAEVARAAKYEQPSFAAQLFLGKLDTSLLYPFPEQDPIDKKIGDDFLDSIIPFLRENLDASEVEREREIPQNVINKLAEVGALAMKIPKEYGGLGMTNTNYNRIIAHISSLCTSTAVFLSAHQSIGVPQPLLMFGTEEQRKKYFPRFRAGEISAFALTEKDVGSDPAKMSTEAVLSEDGTHYILNGEKLWCTNGPIADVIVVMAQTKPKIIKGRERKQITAFILEMKSKGVGVKHRCDFMGLGGVSNGVLTFEDVMIPVENRIDEEGRGLAMALATLNYGRLTLPTASTAGMKFCLKVAREWGNERVQWGKPIGYHEYGRLKVASIASHTLANEAIGLLCSAWADGKKVDMRIEAAMAKMFSTESLWKNVDITLQLRGGRGYETASSLKARGEKGYPVERLMRDIRVNMILEGTTDIMKLFLTREAIDPHIRRLKTLLKGGTPLTTKVFQGLKIAGHYALWYSKLWLTSWWTPSYSEMGKLAKHFRYIHRNCNFLARKMFFLMMRYQQKLESKQMILGRLMDVGTLLFVMAATCSYALAVKTREPKNKDVIALADYFSQTARREIEGHILALKDNDDTFTNKIAQETLEGHFKWLEEGIEDTF